MPQTSCPAWRHSVRPRSRRVRDVRDDREEVGQRAEHTVDHEAITNTMTAGIPEIKPSSIYAPSRSRSRLGGRSHRCCRTRAGPVGRIPIALTPKCCSSPWVGRKRASARFRFLSSSPAPWRPRGTRGRPRRRGRAARLPRAASAARPTAPPGHGARPAGAVPAFQEGADGARLFLADAGDVPARVPLRAHRRCLCRGARRVRASCRGPPASQPRDPPAAGCSWSPARDDRRHVEQRASPRAAG